MRVRRKNDSSTDKSAGMMVRCRLMLPAGLLLLGMFYALYGQNSDIGNFDIGKVREAALSSDSTVSAHDTAVPVEREHVFSVIVRVVLYLVIVIVLIFGVAWFFRRQGLQAARGGGGAMDIIETLPLGQNRMLVMVRVMDELYLLSQTVSSISLIEKISGQKALDIIASSKGGGTMLHFKDALNAFMGKMKKNV